MSALPELQAGQFADFFDALHRDPAVDPHALTPFPWQSRLAERVSAGNAWPTWLALPTASGKTSAIDIAIFALALEAGKQERPRMAPRRIFFVVDRRIVVDEASERARRIASRLAWAAETSAAPPVLRSVALRLKWLAQGGDQSEVALDAVPLEVATLRGGTFRDDCWVRSPLQPAVIASTVDQLGSRLLFRGYGARPGQWPIHAGLCANDSLVILDEAHCSNPFLQVLQSVARYRSAEWAADPLRLPFAVTVMTATPQADATGEILGLDQDDWSHPVLSPRLLASKPAILKIGAKTTSPRGARSFADDIATKAIDFVRSEPVARAVGVIVNRVLGARMVHEALLEKLASLQLSDTVSVVLLTGRMRPIDRDAAVWHLDCIHTGSRRGVRGAMVPLEKPTIVVSTQALEVGADLDFDDLITECASLDALRQRFGRLNRSGREVASRALVVVRGDQATAASEDPIYGQTLSRTWLWLVDRAKDTGVVDFGIRAMTESLSASPSTDLQLTLPDAPVMLPAYLDLWAQTSPRPLVEPAVDVFLHGPDRGVAQVQVCWRADLPAVAPAWPLAIATVAICPPTARECMPVPLSVARRWLQCLDDRGEDSDVEVRSLPEVPDDDDEETIGGDRWALVWRRPGSRDDESFIISSKDLADRSRRLSPGDTLVVPASLKGWDELGHLGPSPIPTDAAIDCAEQMQLTVRRLATIRVNESVIAAWQESPRQQAMSLLSSDPASLEPGSDEIDYLLSEIIANQGDRFRSASARHLRLRKSRCELKPHPLGGFVLSSTRRVAKDKIRSLVSRPSEDLELLFSDGDDGGSATVEVTLSEHLEGVRRWTGLFASGSGLEQSVVDALRRSAELHDVGKADPRFQAWLRGGNRWMATATQLLAKSDGLPLSQVARERARADAGYPRGGRHELLSVRLIESDPRVLQGADHDLVCHLVATHHGWCRPFAPVIVDAIGIQDPSRRVSLRLPNGCVLAADVVTDLEKCDSGVAERYWNVVRRFGWWGAAYLESVLRLADARRSEEEESQKSERDAPEVAE